MSGEKISPKTEQEAQQTTEWDKLTDGRLEDIEEISDDQEDESRDESVTEGMTRRTTKLPSKIENARRNIARRFAPNTMPKMEVIAADVRREPIGPVAELCENWPLFSHTEKITVDGTEIDFPVFHPEVKYLNSTDYTGYLSTADNPEKQIQQIRAEIGKKTASFFVEAALDNPLIATLSLDVYPGRNNSDYTCSASRSGDLKKGVIRLVDESVPLERSLAKLNARLSGLQYEGDVEDAEVLEGMDTVERAMVAYHEMGHGIDFLTNYLKVQKRDRINNLEIIEAVAWKDLQRSRQIECSKSIPHTMITSDILSNDEMRVILERRGFDLRYPCDAGRIRSYNDRAYREMPCESVADDYARMAVCVKHRDHYFAKNEQERQQNPEKRGLPIYGELVYLGAASSKMEKTSFLDQELMECGVIAGKRVVLRMYKKPEGLRYDRASSRYKFPDDFDYSADQREQAQQEILAEGIIKQNPHGGVFEVVDDNGEVIAIFGGHYHRQNNEMGKIDIINGDFSTDEPCYRLEFEYSSEAEMEKMTISQLGPQRFTERLGINPEEETSILLINDNTAQRVLLPKGGFDGAYYYTKHPEYTLTSGKMIGEDAQEYDIPTECYIYNGIPKVKINGELFEVVPGSKADLERLSQKIINASAEAHWGGSA